MGSHFVTQAGVRWHDNSSLQLELLGSSDPLALASHSPGAAGMSHGPASSLKLWRFLLQSRNCCTFVNRFRERVRRTRVASRLHSLI